MIPSLDAPRQPSWTTRLGVVGLALLGIEGIRIAPASITQSWVVVGGLPLGLQSTITQVLLVGLVLVILALGLEVGSRLAWSAGFVIGLAPLATWMALLGTGHPATFEPLPVRVAATGLLVVAGLGLDWPSFWGTPDADGEPTGTPRGGDGFERRPRPGPTSRSDPSP